jgi:1,4-alpha-glucan branching enzyme
MQYRAGRNGLQAPIAIYEVHLGSWMRVPEEGNRWLTYRELAGKLADYAHKMGYTHVEFLPVTEHPFDGSWGYQTVGYYAPTSRFGTPQDFMFLVDTLHQRGIGVILDWVPAHFPTDAHGLGYFDGTHLYEHADPRQGQQPDWGTFVFNFGRNEVRSFLISNALFWFDKYHIDGLRVDAVASVLYLDYGRREGEWIPNRYGGRENLEAIDFLRQLNTTVYGEYPGSMMVAEESTAWPMVSRPTYLGGLGFGFKWNMGWMHDVLEYMSQDPIFRSYRHNLITFSLTYAFSENFVLPFSHDEVVYGKGSMIGKMPGDNWRKFANLRVLYGFMTAHPGKKLLFMGCEFGQWKEWNHDEGLDWALLDFDTHRALQRWVRDLNTLYRAEPALHVLDTDPAGFEWIDCNDSQRSILSFRRKSRRPEDTMLFVCNFTPEPRVNYRVGVPDKGDWREILNGDAPLYGGSGQGNLGGTGASPIPMHGHPYSLNLTLPPLAMIAFKKMTHEG